MKDQNYKNHAQWVAGYHFITLPLMLITLILATVNFARLWGQPNFLALGALPFLLAVLVCAVAWYARVFPLKVQDRAIRAEENFRHFILTGKPLDPNLTMPQIIALRFASDNSEYLDLANRIVKENMSPADIKKSIDVWKTDHHRA